MNQPYLVDFSSSGNAEIGFLTIAEHPHVPFDVKRVYWTYSVPEDIIRGHHAHHDLEQLIFAVNGEIIFVLEGLDGSVQEFILDKPNIGLYIPKLYWRTIKFSREAVLLCLASKQYDEDDYIRNYTDFHQLVRKTQE